MDQFLELDAEEVLEPNAVTDYRAQQGSLRPSLITLHTNLSILRQLQEYPSGLYEIDDRFFGYLQFPLFHYSIIVASRLWGDPSSDSGLDIFRNRVISDWIRPEYEEALREILAPISSERPDDDLFQRLRNARNKRFAHIDLELHVGDYPLDNIAVNINELSGVADWLGRMFNALNFGKRQLLVQYSLEYGNDPTDGALGWVLECMAVQSNLVRSYDKHPDWWRQNKLSNLSDEELEDLNRLRAKFGMESVST